MNHVAVLMAAYIIDRILGDPRWIPHPVIYMGKGIQWLEKKIRSWSLPEERLKGAGILFPVMIAGGSYGAVWLLLKGLMLLHPYLAWGMEVWLISTTIATKGLTDAGLEIYHLSIQGKLKEARVALSMVVGRDTHSLDQLEVSRGAVETVAENIVDAILSPLFYAAIGGAPLAMAYRAINTLDSMVGYKDEQYLHLGWASARLDDGANFLPARLAAVMLVFASWLQRLDWRGCWKVISRDARLHPSPNSGFTEAGVAGALGIQLGGTNYYKGKVSHRAKMGDPVRGIKPSDITQTIGLMKLVSSIFLIVCILVLISTNLLLYGEVDIR